MNWMLSLVYMQQLKRAQNHSRTRYIGSKSHKKSRVGGDRERERGDWKRGMAS